MLLLVNALYFILLFAISIISLFVVFHVVKYSYSASSAFFMLALFLPVTAVLIFLNAGLFLSINFAEVFSYLLKM